jgi:hypothetical protein
LPVQYFRGVGEKFETMAATLVAPSRTEPGLWQLSFHVGAGRLSQRTGVKFSPVPKAGCWSYLPE